MPTRRNSAESLARQSVLAVRALSVRRANAILRELSWTVRAGEHWVVLGPNGAGKTSLLNAVTGYLTPSSGRIEVLGNVFGETDWRDLRAHIGLVSASLAQRIEPDQLPEEIVAGGRTAMINVWGPIRRVGMARARSLLAELGCAYLARRVWAVLSQGERQRVLIARALMAKPAVLFLDEPCAGLDPVARENFLSFLQRVATTPDGPALSLVTHHVEEIVPAFTHALLLKDGAALASGPLRRVLTSALLTEAFNHPVRVRRREGRWAVSIRAA